MSQDRSRSKIIPCNSVRYSVQPTTGGRVDIQVQIQGLVHVRVIGADGTAKRLRLTPAEALKLSAALHDAFVIATKPAAPSEQDREAVSLRERLMAVWKG